MSATAVAPVPPDDALKLTTGVWVYPEPPAVSWTLVTTPPTTVNMPATPVPPPPPEKPRANVPLVYPVPPEISVTNDMPLTDRTA